MYFNPGNNVVSKMTKVKSFLGNQKYYCRLDLDKDTFEVKLDD